MAIKTQGTQFKVSTADGTPKVITAITAAAPPVVTSTSHGLANGTVVVLDGIVGMTELNGRAFVVASTATNTFELAGIDATTYAAYASAGTATAKTMTAIASVIDGDQFDGTAPDIDTTHLMSTAAEKLQGLPDFGGGTLSIFHVTDTGQAKLRSLKAKQISGTFSIVRTDGAISAFVAYVKQYTAGIQGNNAHRGTVALSYAFEPSWFA